MDVLRKYCTLVKKKKRTFLVMRLLEKHLTLSDSYSNVGRVPGRFAPLVMHAQRLKQHRKVWVI